MKKYRLFLITIAGLLLIQAGFVQRSYAQKPPFNQQLNQNEITSEREEKVLHYVSQAYPYKYENLIQLRSRRPALYRQALLRAYKEMQFAERLREENPEQYENLKLERELESQSQELAEQYKNAETDAEKEAIEEKLRSVLIQAFEVRQANRQFEIDKLELRLQELKEKNEERQQNKTKIIQLRIDELLGLGELKW